MLFVQYTEEPEDMLALNEPFRYNFMDLLERSDAELKAQIVSMTIREPLAF